MDQPHTGLQAAFGGLITLGNLRMDLFREGW